MAEIFATNKAQCHSSKDEVSDLTFDNYCSPRESKYIVKAVGDILLEIQKFISNQGSDGSINPSLKVNVKSKVSNSDKRLNYKSSQIHSDEEIAQPINEINSRIEQTYHRRVLDQVVSQHKKPVDCQNGSLDWKKIESHQFPMVNESKFLCSELTSQRQPYNPELKGVARIGNVYGINRVKLSINAFVSSFYKHYPIVSYSSFILSLIYIDRFIKSQCSQDLRELSKFSLTRIFLVSIIIAMKYHEEYYIENRYFFKQASKYCSITDIKELNQLEKEFLKAIDYRLTITKEEQTRYFGLVMNRSKELQCQQFKVHIENYTIYEDHFSLKNSDHGDLDSIRDDETINCPTKKCPSLASKLPQIILNGKIFQSGEEVYNFFNCEDPCEDKSTFSGSTSHTLSEDSPRIVNF